MPFQSKLTNLASRREKFQKRITLLSGGFARPESFPKGEITVYPWDTQIDDWLADRAKKGDQTMVLYELCGKLCDLNGCPLDRFVIGDVNTVLLVSRSIRYNSIIEYEAACPYCGWRSDEQIGIPDELGRVGEKSTGYPGYDRIELPDCKDVVDIRPLMVKDERMISTRDDISKKLITDHVMHILTPIVAINDGRPDGFEPLYTWFNALPPQDAEYLEQKENELYPHLDTDIPHTCDRCSKRFVHALDFSKEFFRTSLKPGKGAKMENAVRPGNEQPESGAGAQPSPGRVPGDAGGIEQRAS